jgi:DNA-binding SARP family transcriptional activator
VSIVPDTVTLRLIGGFGLSAEGRSIPIPSVAQRLLAFLALHQRPVRRTFVAAALWPEQPEARGTANLRATLWRMPSPGITLVICTPTQLALAPELQVDLTTASEEARRLVDRTADDVDDAADALCLDLIAGDLLPGWDEDWVDLDRERFRQLRVHALESLCRRHLRSGRSANAVDVGLAAVAAEPMRESARRALIEAHLAEGNTVDAVNVYRSFERLLRDELDLQPSPMIDDLMAAYLAPSGATATAAWSGAAR